MDYYLIDAAAGDPSPAAMLVEEFVLCDDYTAAGIDTAAWRPAARAWAGAARLSRDLRSDAGLRARVTAVDRRAAAQAYARLGGGELPSEPQLRARSERQPLPGETPLDLGTSTGARRYRILFAGELGADALASARTALRLEPTGDPRVAGAAAADADGHGFSWELRRIGTSIAWCVDVTARLGAAPATALGALLHHHRQAIRALGLIPVTIERFA
ncbi:hypothetical protein E1292_47530 [Nonomuraea deserti]|uniref:Uncharacterized protein n=1 Tax=Nonomuraea deserti TaxID=1848322 RepID=A0A4R4UDS6_9ACTN|nr:hypothetical protein [Nonomuraea deserti]TDC86692.1 hypothetical protein E1292_47530 [Nonomuraea deserti]